MSRYTHVALIAVVVAQLPACSRSAITPDGHAPAAALGSEIVGHDSDDPNAEVEQGKRYVEGRELPRDVERARALFLDAARKGHLQAPLLLATSYLFFANPPDLARACGWLRVAREDRFEDHAFAAHLLEEIRGAMSPSQLEQCAAFSKENYAALSER